MRIKIVFTLLLVISLQSVSGLSPLMNAQSEPLPDVGPMIPLSLNSDHRTLISSLPYTISTPGSYYVTNDLTGAAGSDGIIIAAEDVTIDLNGYTLRGVPGSGHGIYNDIGVTRYNLRIHNGTVRGWGGDGIYTLNYYNCQFEDLKLCQNISSGMRSGHAIVRGCSANENGDRGFLLHGKNTVVACIAQDNNGIGFDISGVVVDCVATSNGDDGFNLVNTSTMVNCNAGSNGGDGLSSDNSGSTFSGCSSRSNTGAGLRVSWSNTIKDCTVYNNHDNGIITKNKCQIIGNLCTDNTGAGISVEGSGTRIDSNTTAGNTTGIQVTGTFNTIIRNSAHYNLSMNYDIAIDNDVGPIGSAANSTSPWANIVF